MGPLIAGVAVFLLFSVAWPLPIREANGFLCLGVALSGFVAGLVAARANDERLESVRGLKLGAQVGLVSALIVIAIDLLVDYTTWFPADKAGVDYLDPIPRYIYLAIYGIWDGLLDLVDRSGVQDGLEWPGRIARYLILIVSSVLFAGFGGGVAASTVNQPSLEEEPEPNAETPLRPSYVRYGVVQPIQVQPPREAQIYQPEEEARPAAATGTDPAGYAYPPPSGGYYAPRDESGFVPQPRFDERQEGYGYRSGSEMSVEPPRRTRRLPEQRESEER